MRIISLQIFNTHNVLVRRLSFHTDGITFIYGNIEAPKNQEKSTNSLGKSIALSLIDNILRGSSEDHNQLGKPEIQGYKVIAQVDYNGEIHTVSRQIGAKEHITVDNNEMDLEKYREFFSLNTSDLSIHSIIYPKIDLLTNHKGNNRSEVKKILKSLNLLDIFEKVSKVYETQDSVNKLVDTKNELIRLLELDIKTVDNKIFQNSKTVKELETKIEGINKDISDLDFIENTSELQDRFSTLNAMNKERRNVTFLYKSEIEKSREYLSSNQTFSLSKNEINDIYMSAKVILPENVTKRIEDVYLFYQQSIQNRNNQVKNRMEYLQREIQSLENEIALANEEVERIAKVLSGNKIYKNAVQLLTNFHDSLRKAQEDQSNLLQISRIQRDYEKKYAELTSLFSDLKQLQISQQNRIGLFRKFIYELVEKTYGPDAKTVFNIIPRKTTAKNSPIQFQFELSGTGVQGGFKQAQNNIFDYMITNFSETSDFFIQDSSSYDSMDPRQISKLLEELDGIGKVTHKQIIISMNKYKVDENTHNRIINDAYNLILSEDDPLFKMNF